MRPLTLKMISPLLLLVAAPFFGCGQVRAGMLYTETLPPSPDVVWWQDSDEASSAPSISRAPESSADRADDEQAHGLDALPTSPSGIPKQIDTTHAKARPIQPGCPEGWTTVAPAGSASLFLCGPRTRLPNPLLSRLFRPPR